MSNGQSQHCRLYIFFVVVKMNLNGILRDLWVQYILLSVERRKFIACLTLLKLPFPGLYCHTSMIYVKDPCSIHIIATQSHMTCCEEL